MLGLGVIFGNCALLCACERMSRHRLCKSGLIQTWSGADCVSSRLGLVPKVTCVWLRCLMRLNIVCSASNSEQCDLPGASSALS